MQAQSTRAARRAAWTRRPRHALRDGSPSSSASGSSGAYDQLGPPASISGAASPRSPEGGGALRSGATLPTARFRLELALGSGASSAADAMGVPGASHGGPARPAPVDVGGGGRRFGSRAPPTLRGGGARRPLAGGGGGLGAEMAAGLWRHQGRDKGGVRPKGVTSITELASVTTWRPFGNQFPTGESPIGDALNMF